MRTSKAQTSPHIRAVWSAPLLLSQESIIDKLATRNISAFYWTNLCNLVGWFEPCMVGNPEDRSSRWGPDNFCDPVSFPQIDILFFFFLYVSSDKVCFKRFDFTYIHVWASWACVITMHSVTDIRVPPVVPIQPKTFRLPQRPLDFKNPEQRIVYPSWFDSCYFCLIWFYVPSTIFQLNRDGRQLLRWSERSHVMPTEAKT